MGAAALPVALALGAAFLFGIQNVVAKRGLAHVDAQTGALVTIGTTLLVYLATAPLWMRASDWFTPGFWIFVVNGLLHPMASMYLSLEATSRTGPTVAATLSSTSPLFAALTAVLALGESINALIGIGTLAIVLGVMRLSWSGGGIATVVRTALVFATGAAAVRGVTQTTGKLGLELLPSPFMAAFVSFAVSFTGSLCIYAMRRGHLPLAVPRRGLLWFAATGSISAGAIACMYTALFTGAVVVVSPIIAAYPLFTLLTALVFRQEAMSRLLVLGVCLVVGGVALIAAGAGR